MDVSQLLDVLGYPDSRGFLPISADEPMPGTVADHGHVFRQAAREPCSLQGVYVLEPPWEGEGIRPVVPAVYVCRARSEEQADTIHRLVWNQDIVPFLVVHTPLGVKLYSGFRFDPGGRGAERGILRMLRAFDDLQELIELFHAESIDGGRLWRQLGREVTPEHRVDWRLLRNLRALDERLRTSGGLDKAVSHALIGKYVYFHYLKDRGILSPRRLADWGLEPGDVFGRHARLEAVAELGRRLESWLNGEIFPLDFEGGGAPGQEHLSWVAGAFAGDDLGETYHQLALDFRAYDFSYIPIETLSVIYEQFLHSPEEGSGSNRGKEAGAYYTPLPLVSFMLAEMEDHLPLKAGMAVFDPSCGSGAFLVQCYRRLIEKERVGRRRRSTPAELRDLLVDHVFGVDRDPDACAITELSLMLTLLDYLEPSELETFRLPTLRGRNIFHADFFTDQVPWLSLLARDAGAWVVGNPPWKKLSPGKLGGEDVTAWRWMTRSNEPPIGDHQLAQAFVWRLLEELPANAYVGLLLPAMTLFESNSEKFRAAFFERARVDVVANFANLAEVLFAGRSRVPAAAFFFRSRDRALPTPEKHRIAVYSPLVANQEATRPTGTGERKQSWSLVVNAAEVRGIALDEVAGGEALPWKLATWGSAADVRLLAKLRRRHPSLAELEKQGVLIAAEGPQLKKDPVEKGLEKTEKHEDLLGKPVLDLTRLRGVGKTFRLPSAALKKNEACHLRIRGGKRGLDVCSPPHVIVNAGRRFAVYSDEFVIVPPRQIGIAGTGETEDPRLLAALSLYLSSDFAFYHQFLTSAQFGVKRDVATLAALRKMPVPLLELSSELTAWQDLHERLVEASCAGADLAPPAQGSLFQVQGGELGGLLEELNERTYQALGIAERERVLVHDLVRVRLELNDGKLGEAAIRHPTEDELERYAVRLRRELDAFLGPSQGRRHDVAVVFDELSGMVHLDLVAEAETEDRPFVARADSATAAAFEATRRRLGTRRAQWVYFDRNLRLYEGTRTFIFKPMQRFHWTESQALTDAREIIAETLAGGEAA